LIILYISKYNNIHRTELLITKIINYYTYLFVSNTILADGTDGIPYQHYNDEMSEDIKINTFNEDFTIVRTPYNHQLLKNTLFVC